MVDNIIPFSKTTWTKVTNSISKWISLCGAEANIATNLQNISVDSKMNILNDSAIGFYQRCCNKFSDKARIEAAEKRLIRLQNVPQQLQQPDNQTNVGDIILKPINQSVFYEALLQVFGPIRATPYYQLSALFVALKNILKKNILLKESEQSSQTVKQTITFYYLLPLPKKDENLLIKLRYNDMVEIEVKYYRLCYKQYTKQFTFKYTPVSGDKSHDESFKEFCSEIIKKKE